MVTSFFPLLFSYEETTDELHDKPLQFFTIYTDFKNLGR